MTAACISCKFNKDSSSVPGGRIKEYMFWILEHIIEPVPLKGWLILKTKRHAEGITALNENEARELGEILNTLPKIQKDILNAEQIYICCFTEEVSHLHFHLIPRYSGEVLKGPKIFEKLREAKSDRSKSIDVEEAIKVAQYLRTKLQ